MARDPDASRLRRYVVAKAAGRVPLLEWTYFTMLAPGLGAWMLADEEVAKRRDHWRHVRIQGDPWCDVLGSDIGVAADVDLQAYFSTIDADAWPKLAIMVNRSSERCLREWRVAGRRIREAALGVATGRSPLAEWLGKKRKVGERTLRGSLQKDFARSLF